MLKVYGGDICPDCIVSKKVLAEKGVEFLEIDITKSVPSLKEFLLLRDTLPLFDGVRQRGAVGIPLFVLEDKSSVDLNEALSWVGETAVPQSEYDAMFQDAVKVIMANAPACGRDGC